MSNVAIVKPVVGAAQDFLTAELGLQAAQEPASEQGLKGTSHEINILVGVTGLVRGQVIFSMPHATAKGVASIMLGRQVGSLDKQAQSALCELGNMIAGMAVSRFDERHADVALTPPNLIVGKNLYFSVLKIGCFHVSFKSEVGIFDVMIALEESPALRQSSAA